MVSSDGSKLAVQTDLSDGRILLSTFETESYELLATVEVDAAPESLTIDNAGGAYWFSNGLSIKPRTPLPRGRRPPIPSRRTARRFHPDRGGDRPAR